MSGEIPAVGMVLFEEENRHDEEEVIVPVFFLRKRLMAWADKFSRILRREKKNAQAFRQRKEMRNYGRSYHQAFAGVQSGLQNGN